MSAEAAVYFLQQILRMQGQLFPRLQILGIVPTMVQEARRLADYEERGEERLKQFGQTRLRRDDLLMMAERIPQRADIARFAGAGVAYLRRPTVAPIFDRLGREVQRRMK
jgi:cellulose biosynthesis protein BcsQ